MTDSTKNYIVDYAIKKDGDDYVAGDYIELTDAEAAPLLNLPTPVIHLPEYDDEESDDDTGSSSNNVVKIKQDRPTDDKEALEAIIAVINELDSDDESHWTADKKPDATVLTEKLGWKVSAADRDAAWAKVKTAEKDSGQD